MKTEIEKRMDDMKAWQDKYHYASSRDERLRILEQLDRAKKIVLAMMAAQR